MATPRRSVRGKKNFRTIIILYEKWSAVAIPLRAAMNSGRNDPRRVSFSCPRKAQVRGRGWFRAFSCRSSSTFPAERSLAGGRFGEIPLGLGYESRTADMCDSGRIRDELRQSNGPNLRGSLFRGEFVGQSCRVSAQSRPELDRVVAPECLGQWKLVRRALGWGCEAGSGRVESFGSVKGGALGLQLGVRSWFWSC